MCRPSTRARRVADAPLSSSPLKKKQSVHSQKAAPVELPYDLVYSILLLLPMKSLLLFRCVSKQCNEMIESRRFSLDLMKMHSRKESPVTSIIHSLPNSEQDRSHVVVHRTWYEQGDLHQDTLRLKFPVQVRDTVDDIWMSTCSCDGLLCLIYEKRTAFSRHPTLILIWNPLTGCYKTVLWPKDVLDRYYGLCTFVGFGYDEVVRDYKIVVLSSSHSDPESSLIKVRALKSDVWTTVDASAASCNMIRSYDMLEPVGVEEDVYWIGRNRDDKSPAILKFSLAEEKLTTVPFPFPRWETGKKMSVKLGHHHGSLYAYAFGFFDDDGQELIEVWKHSQHSKNLAWEKVLIILKGSLPRGVDRLEPLGFARNGNFMMINHHDNTLLAYVWPQDVCVKIKRNQDILPEESTNNCQIHFMEMETLIKP